MDDQQHTKKKKPEKKSSSRRERTKPTKPPKLELKPKSGPEKGLNGKRAPSTPFLLRLLSPRSNNNVGLDLSQADFRRRNSSPDTSAINLLPVVRENSKSPRFYNEETKDEQPEPPELSEEFIEILQSTKFLKSDSKVRNLLFSPRNEAPPEEGKNNSVVDSEIQKIEKIIDKLPNIPTEETELVADFTTSNEEIDTHIETIKETLENIDLLIQRLIDDINSNAIGNLITMYERLECLLQRYTQIKESNELLKQKQAKSVAASSKNNVERTVVSRSKTQQPKAHLQAIHTHSSGSNQQSSLPNLSIHQLRAILQENQHLIQSNDFSSPLTLVSNPFEEEKKNEEEEDEDEGTGSKEEKKEVKEEEEEEEEEVEGEEKFPCKICLEDKSARAFYNLSQCNHQYCKSCLREFIVCKVADGSVLSIDCPDPECKLPFLHSDIENLVAEATIHKYDQLKILTELNMNPNCRWCPRPGCNTAIIGDPSQELIVCTSCQQQICFKCKHAWHEGKTCEEYEKQKKRHDAEEQSWDKWAKENAAKQCPKCGVWIVRPTGCNQVICKSCQFSFCWLCLKECIVPDHYSYGECSGKWFEETTLTTGQKIAAGVILGGIIIVASPLLVVAGGVFLGRKLKRKVTKGSGSSKKPKSDDSKE